MMDGEQQDALAAAIRQQAQQTADYVDRAVLLELADFAEAQQRRITTTGGEIDGRSWDHEHW
ncbi:hypothetical protein LH991_06890 [Schleiferilactobacillus harbinensis]|jgi:hypothetical protein|uniref:Uncharacterized protein n=2 Tax=Schleiferilactobacillus harbinensis TaxID=304207 RepID=A0A510TZM4_9LACO|nr:hypothetical protein [Schleiferilactobacillus harbinensis]KRM27959.1 hypothetical protein FC91_GL002249 [Schleiferilactobacillus harbinensis DSM 16991]MBO3091768.1 hypothetical protein [Schleiferilactobacillus harbinensis]MCI1686737.1 hypothetical protein [Schleiferilactobacillus harbinensis]MCI1784007.1 hypothetical protein [Schleiferilactobacillus harbinensis]MCI1849556.1 hypothetical protein [Schleiferilactobacillus harbinensis]